MNYSVLDEFCAQNGIEFTINEPMSKHTSFKIGGNADRFIKVKNKEELAQIIKICKINKIKTEIIGNGSNLLVTDKGIRAAVLSLVGDFNKIELIDDKTIICGAGVMLSALCAFAKQNSLTGLEFAYGIPGTVGGAVYMNAGAYGGEIKDVLIKSYHLDEQGYEGSLTDNELDLSYRRSIYTDLNYIITYAFFKLQKDDIKVISSKMNDLMGKRKDKQPLEYPSAGSTFKRPEGYFAAALIEECGLKGMCVNSAQVSTKHSGFVINKGNATCEDVINLIEKVKSVVRKQKNIELECEIKIIGE